MAQLKATILIPDISGFTEYMTTTELNHSSYAINKLINSIVNELDEEYILSEIEGDAVLIIRKGDAPSQQQVMDTCLKIFNAFHRQRNWMQHHTVCPCAACSAIGSLTLKFVVHYGPLVEMKVGPFIKYSGTEMIVAHRLMKNNINKDEYVLMTESFLAQTDTKQETIHPDWMAASEEYSSIGKVDFRFKLLDEERLKVSVPTDLKNEYTTDETPFEHLLIAKNYKEVYRRVAKIPARARWVPGLQRVEQQAPEVFVGSVHECTFADHLAIVSPLKMILAPNEIKYAEKYSVASSDVLLVFEYSFTAIEEDLCDFAYRFINIGQVPIPDKLYTAFAEQLGRTAESLKRYCEGTFN